jgi:uncharacterized peroxidase-related enzyme
MFLDREQRSLSQREVKIMARIPTPATIEAAPEAARPVLEAMQKQLGRLPNIFRIVSNSPAALNAYVGLNGALQKGALPAATRERIALALAEVNGCDYCLAAHTYFGKNFSKLDESEIAENRRGSSTDAKAAATIEFAVKLTKTRGDVTPDEIEALRAAGYSDAQVVEIFAHVALSSFTNYVNKALGTEIDFPLVDRLVV